MKFFLIVLLALIALALWLIDWFFGIFGILLVRVILAILAFVFIIIFWVKVIIAFIKWLGQMSKKNAGKAVWDIVVILILIWVITFIPKLIGYFLFIR